MNAKPYLVLVYQLTFALASLLLAFTVEGYGTETFAGTFYFTLSYLIVGSITNYLTYLFWQRIYFKNRKKLLMFHFLTCILLINLFSYFVNYNLVTLTLLKGFFAHREDSFWIALILHILVFICYFLSIKITKRWMLKSGNSETFDH